MVHVAVSWPDMLESRRGRQASTVGSTVTGNPGTNREHELRTNVTITPELNYKHNTIYTLKHLSYDKSP